MTQQTAKKVVSRFSELLGLDITKTIIPSKVTFHENERALEILLYRESDCIGKDNLIRVANEMEVKYNKVIEQLKSEMNILCRLERKEYIDLFGNYTVDIYLFAR